MPLATFARFLYVANQHRDLLIDLAAEDTLLGVAQLYSYLERYHIPPTDKRATIDGLVDAGILQAAEEDVWTLNPLVADLINHYERRGNLAAAGFLRDQISEIGRYTDDLQRQLSALPPDPGAIGDTLDALYRLLREVRTTGDGHYQACMHMLGELKRESDRLTIDARIEKLETLQRRHITPIAELVDPDAGFSHRIGMLQRQLGVLRADRRLRAQSLELENRRRMVRADLEYIHHALLRGFVQMVDTARAMVNALLDERKIKHAVAGCLADLPAVWAILAGTTVQATAYRSAPWADSDALADFFNHIVHRRYLPQPRPLVVPAPTEEFADEQYVPDGVIWATIAAQGTIASWPRYVLKEYTHLAAPEQLRVLTFPLISAHPRVQLQSRSNALEATVAQLALTIDDFGLQWRDE